MAPKTAKKGPFLASKTETHPAPAHRRWENEVFSHLCAEISDWHKVANRPKSVFILILAGDFVPVADFGAEVRPPSDSSS